MGDVPRISEFYGIVILMFHNDHRPAHFHVRYADSKRRSRSKAASSWRVICLRELLL